MASTETSELNSNDTVSDDVISEEELEKKRLEPYVKLPKWLRILLMFIPSLVIIGIVLIINYTVGFPATINPTAIIAIIGISLFALVVLGDMVYRNIFVYKMLRHESRKSRVYKQILREREEKEAKGRQEFEQENEYEYDDDEEVIDSEEEIVEMEEIEDEVEEEEYEEEYSYDLEDDREHVRLKSFILRGGIMTILIINSFVLLAAAAILQITLFGGFTPPE
ncbi:MAG: hypothetical protein FK733_13285 [Asgard group archaeon]|nr:hypothetical protein [Asgard group archaeon]